MMMSMDSSDAEYKDTYAATNQNFNILARLQPMIILRLLRKSVI